MPAIATRCIACDEPTLERQSAVLMPFVAQRALGWEPCEITADWGLRSVPLGHALPLCMSLHCQRCGLLFLDMRFDEAEMARLYADYRGAAYTALRERWEPGYAARNAQLEVGDAHVPALEAWLAPQVAPRPRILDWGGDTGRNTPLRGQAAAHHVLDISGRPLVPGAVAVTTESVQLQRYELVVLSNVVEHTPWPATLLHDVAAAVQGDAVLYLEVPFEATMRAAGTDALAWRSKRHWHEHINFFSRAALRQLVDGAGLMVQAETVFVLDGGAHQLGLACGRANAVRPR